MGVILGKGTHTHDAVQSTRRLITVTGTKLGQAHRQFTVAFQPLIEHLHVARAVHRLDRVIAALRLSGEHVFSVVGPVPGLFPQAAVDDLRGLDLKIAVLALDLAHVLLKNLVKRPAIRMPEHHARRFFLGVEQAKALADFTVITLLGFFNTQDISCQLLFISPGRAIDTLQLLVLGIATPVGARQFGQLERFQEARIRDVRPAAHVDVFFMEVQAHGLFVRHVFDQAQLVVFAPSSKQLNYFSTRRHLLDDVVVFFDQLLHALFDSRHVIRSKRTLVGDIVVKAFVNDRADHHLGSWIQLLDRMTDQVGTRVTNDFQPLFILGRDDLQRGVIFDQVTGINQLAVDLAGHSGLGQTCTNGCGDLGNGYRVIE